MSKTKFVFFLSIKKTLRKKIKNFIFIFVLQFPENFPMWLLLLLLIVIIVCDVCVFFFAYAQISLFKKAPPLVWEA